MKIPISDIKIRVGRREARRSEAHINSIKGGSDAGKTEP